MEQLEKIITTEGAADTAQEGARKINDNFDKVYEAMGETLPKTGDASLTTSSLSTPPTPVNPTSGSTLSLLLGTLWSWISAFVSGDKEVSSATKASRDALGRVISDTYATQDYVDQKVTGVYRPCGSVQDVAALLALTGVKTGDVYDVQQAGTLGDKQIKAGDNVVALADNPSATQWDILSGTVDLSGYLPKTGDSSNTIVVFSPESGEPASGSSLSSIVGRIVKKISDIVSGAIAVAKAASADSATRAMQDADGNKISDTYLKRSGGTMTGNLALSNEVRVNGAVGNLIGRFTWAGGLKAVVGNSQDTLALLSKDAATLNGSPIFTRAGGLVSGTLVQKKGNCSIHTDVASYRMPDNHTGWVRIDFGLLGAELLGVIDMIVYGKGGISIDFSGYTYVSSSNPTANNWYGPKYGIRGSVDAPMPKVLFAKDNTTGRRYIMIGGDGFAWGPYGFISLSKIVLGSLGNTTGDLGVSIEAVSGNYADLGLTNASVSNPSVNVEVERARKDGNGKDIPTTYATKAEVSSLSIGGVNYITGLKDGWEAGYVNQTNGTVTTPDNYNVVTKDYQDISPLAGKRATISASYAPIEITGSTYYFSLRYAFYDTDKNFISGGSTDGKTPSIVSMDVPATATYVKVSAGVGKYGYALNYFETIRLKLELGDYATDYSLAPQDIPTVNDLPDVYVDTVPSNPKDGDILITTTD